MGLIINNQEVESLVSELAVLMGVTKMEAVRQALEEKSFFYPGRVLGTTGVKN